ncbi:MAG: T9SS type A sorting domain-containing protein [Bacteroidales bacterium]|nr:T9SS type A sorting domain-containing protein [Bacteroidales bacterium]
MIRKIYGFLCICLLMGGNVSGQDAAFNNPLPEWLPQSYETYRWNNLDPGNWQPEYYYSVFYYPDGKLKTQIQIKSETRDTLFKTIYSYSNAMEGVATNETKTLQYLNNGSWIPVSLHIEKISQRGLTLENLLYTWTNSYAWVQQSGNQYTYLFSDDGKLIRTIRMDYSAEEGKYIPNSREVYYYNANGLETHLAQRWNESYNDWEHFQRTDAIFSTGSTPDSLFYRAFIDSVWKVTSVKTDLEWYSYENFVNAYQLSQYTIVYPLNGELTASYRYRIEYGNNGSQIKTGERYSDGQWQNFSRTKHIFDTSTNPVEIRNDSWNNEWVPTYWVTYINSYQEGKWLEQIAEHYNLEYNQWEKDRRIVYSNHSMTNITQPKVEATLRIFPVPAKTHINITLPSGFPAIENIRIHSINGESTEFRIPKDSENLSIPIAGFPTGMYILTIHCGNPTPHHFSYKILKQ